MSLRVLFLIVLISVSSDSVVDIQKKLLDVLVELENLPNLPSSHPRLEKIDAALHANLLAIKDLHQKSLTLLHEKKVVLNQISQEFTSESNMHPSDTDDDVFAAKTGDYHEERRRLAMENQKKPPPPPQVWFTQPPADHVFEITFGEPLPVRVSMTARNVRVPEDVVILLVVDGFQVGFFCPQLASKQHCKDLPAEAPLPEGEFEPRADLYMDALLADVVAGVHELVVKAVSARDWKIEIVSQKLYFTATPKSYYKHVDYRESAQH